VRNFVPKLGLCPILESGDDDGQYLRKPIILITVLLLRKTKCDRSLEDVLIIVIV
jgi:hypothetical protein